MGRGESRSMNWSEGVVASVDVAVVECGVEHNDAVCFVVATCATFG